MEFDVELVRMAIIYLATLILSISIHEFGHAFVADRLGDPLPRAQGRVTLNPIAHIDPIGTIAFPLLGFLFAMGGSSLGRFMLGWGKPVQVSLHPARMTRRFRAKTAHLFIAAAGPMMNLLLAAIASALYLLLLQAQVSDRGLVVGLIQMNIGLALFNLIPCPPLDGGTIFAGLAPDRSPVVAFLQRHGQMIFFALLFTGLISILMRPVHWLTYLWIGQLQQWAP